jgi:hypothetical protein
MAGPVLERLHNLPLSYAQSSSGRPHHEETVHSTSYPPPQRACAIVNDIFHKIDFSSRSEVRSPKNSTHPACACLRSAYLAQSPSPYRNRGVDTKSVAAIGSRLSREPKDRAISETVLDYTSGMWLPAIRAYEIPVPDAVR